MLSAYPFYRKLGWNLASGPSSAISWLWDPSGFPNWTSVFPSVKWRCLGYIFLLVPLFPFPPEQRVWNSKAKVTLIKWCGLVNNPALRSASGSNLKQPRDLRFQTPISKQKCSLPHWPPPFLSNSAPVLWVKQLGFPQSSEAKHVIGSEG